MSPRGEDRQAEICPACDGTGERGRTGILGCLQCRGTGEVRFDVDPAEEPAGGWFDDAALPESRLEKRARLEAEGVLEPGCPGCAAFYDHPTFDAFAPRHKASRLCESGKRAHCTCSACWG